MCKSHITAKKFAKLLFELMFYKLIIYAAFAVSGYAPITLEFIVAAIIPFTSITYSFFSVSAIE